MGPIVTVVMAAYNEELFIETAVRSIMKQTFREWELTIVDDASTDNTSAILENLVAEDDRISVVRNCSNRGLAASLNIGISLTRSIFVARADADDFYEPERLQVQLEFLECHPNIDVVGTGARLLGDSGKALGYVVPPTTHNELEKLPFHKTLFLHPSVMMRRTFFENYGVYDETLLRAQDKELWIRGLFKGARYANIDEPLFSYRTNEYKRSWRSIYQSKKSLFKICNRYCIKYGFFYLFIMTINDIAIKLGVRTPKSLKR